MWGETPFITHDPRSGRIEHGSRPAVKGKTSLWSGRDTVKHLKIYWHHEPTMSTVPNVLLRTSITIVCAIKTTKIQTELPLCEPVAAAKHSYHLILDKSTLFLGNFSSASTLLLHRAVHMAGQVMALKLLLAGAELWTQGAAKG